MNRKLFILPIIAAALTISCEKDSPNDIQVIDNNAVDPKTTTITYEGDGQVKSIIDASCLGCHGTSPSAGFSLTNYDEVKKYMDNGSLLNRISKKSGEQGVMPPSGPLPSTKIETIQKWKDDGLQEKSETTN